MDALIEAADAMLAQPGYVAANPGTAEGMLHRLWLATSDPTRSEEVRKRAAELVAELAAARQPTPPFLGSSATD
jgi:hypothetical protein